jgi:hypothetical protein
VILADDVFAQVNNPNARVTFYVDYAGQITDNQCSNIVNDHTIILCALNIAPPFYIGRVDLQTFYNPQTQNLVFSRLIAYDNRTNTEFASIDYSNVADLYSSRVQEIFAAAIANFQDSSDTSEVTLMKADINPVGFIENNTTSGDIRVLMPVDADTFNEIVERVPTIRRNLNSIPSDRIFSDAVTVDLARRGYQYQMTNLHVNYRDPNDRVKVVTVDGSVVSRELGDNFERIFGTIDGDYTVLTRGAMEITSADSKAELYFEFDEISLATTLRNHVFKLGLELGQPDRNYPFVWGGGNNIVFEVQPDSSHQIWRNIGKLSFKWGRYNNFSYRGIRDIESSWFRFNGGSVFDFSEQPEFARRLMINTTEFGIESSNLLKWFDNENSDRFNVRAILRYQLPYKILNSEEVNGPVTLDYSGEIINPEGLKVDFTPVKAGKYTFTRSQLHLGLVSDFNYNPEGLSLAGIYLKSAGVHLFSSDEYVDDVHVDGPYLYYGSSERYTSFIPELTFAYFSTKNNEDLGHFQIRAALGGLNQSILFGTEVKVYRSISFAAKTILYKDFGYRAVLYFSPVIRLNLTR